MCMDRHNLGLVEPFDGRPLDNPFGSRVTVLRKTDPAWLRRRTRSMGNRAIGRGSPPAPVATPSPEPGRRIFEVVVRDGEARPGEWRDRPRPESAAAQASAGWLDDRHR